MSQGISRRQPFIGAKLIKIIHLANFDMLNFLIFFSAMVVRITWHPGTVRNLRNSGV